jgi:N6-adenosine-specific RNA methylase IME4
MTAVLKYDAALQAIAEAKTVDEVTDWIDKAAAVREYGRRIKDRRMELDAIEIRVIAKRRRGELLAAMKETGRLVVGRTRLMSSDNDMITLEELGIERNESSEEQKLAALPLDSFERLKARCRAYAEQHPEKHSFDVLQEDRAVNNRENRTNLATALSNSSLELTGTRQFPCIYADPPWSRKAGIGGRAYENHYPTMTWDEIMALPVRNQTLPDAWLFLWLPRAHVLVLHPVKYRIAIDDGSVHEMEIRTPLAWAIAKAWGFNEFSTLAVWTKTDEDHPDDAGTGLIFRDQDEILCLFKKGRGLPMPKPADKFGSNHRERSKPLGHSRKPQFYRDMIARMTGGLPVLELFARADAENPLPENWEAWGNESQSSDGGVEGHAPEGTVSVAASGQRERLPRDVEAAGPQGEAEAGLPAEMPRAMEQASDRVSQDSDPIAGPTAARGRDGVETIPSETQSSSGEPSVKQALRPQAEADPDREAGLHGGSPETDDDDEILDLPPSFAGELIILKPVRAARQ